MKTDLSGVDWNSIRAETLEHFRNLIRINTANPPGNELEAATYIAALFDKEKIDYTILEKEKGRGNIIARVKGNGNKRPLLLMSHLDVVPVEADKWRVDPFAGEISEGYLWGRGTVDCKNTVVLWLMILIMLKRTGFAAQRDVIFLGAADEEAGATYGARWLVENHFDLLDAEAALNEGGGFCVEFAGKPFYTYQSAEKGNVWLRLTAVGLPGHASMPHADNSTVRLARLISQLSTLDLGFTAIKTVRRMIEIMAASQTFPLNRAVKQILNPLLSELIISKAIKTPSIANGFRAMLNNTICPTVLKAGQKTNVIPSEASVEVDIRTLPGVDQERIVDRIKQTAGERFRIERLSNLIATESVVDHELADTIKSVIAKQVPDAGVIPFMLPASTDGAFFRPKGIVVYGFTPLLPLDDVGLAHAHNERISLKSVDFSLEVGLDVVLNYIK